ncbi:MAG: cation:dicarboxylate symporter family transporter [Eggerthellaceae bacterium]
MSMECWCRRGYLGGVRCHARLAQDHAIEGPSFTARVFTALGLGVLLGLGIQLLLGRDGDAATTALDWISIVGQGYIGLLKMLVMPLVFVAIVGAFTRGGHRTLRAHRLRGVGRAAGHGDRCGRARLGATVLTGLAHAGFLDAATPMPPSFRRSPPSRARCQRRAAGNPLVHPDEPLRRPRDPDHLHHRGRHLLAYLGVAYLRLRDKDVEQADFFKASSTACTASSCG